MRFEGASLLAPLTVRGSGGKELATRIASLGIAPDPGVAPPRLATVDHHQAERVTYNPNQSIQNLADAGLVTMAAEQTPGSPSDKLAPGEKPTLKIAYANQTTGDKVQPDIVVHADGKIEVHHDLDHDFGKGANSPKQITVVVEKDDSTGEATESAKQAVNDFVGGYMVGHLHELYGGQTKQGVLLSDATNLLGIDVTQMFATGDALANADQPTKSAPLNAVDDMNQFANGQHGTISRAAVDSYFPPRVARQLDESDIMTATKDMIAGLHGSNRQEPYDYVGQRSGGLLEVGRYGLCAPQLTYYFESVVEMIHPAFLASSTTPLRLIWRGLADS